MLLFSIFLLALTRAEIVERMRAPVVTKCDGMVKVYADCPEDMRKEYQTPVARFAADIIELMYRSHATKPVRFDQPAIMLHIGSGRTNNVDVVTRVMTNDNRVVTKIYLVSPAYSDLIRFRNEIIKAYHRTVNNEELNDDMAASVYRRAIPEFRIADDRAMIEDWYAGRRGDDEAMIKLRRKVLEPGVATKREVLTFASRLFLYPPRRDILFAGKFDSVDFKNALKFAKIDARIRMAASAKADEVIIFGGGRGELLSQAAETYSRFLRELAAYEKTEKELKDILDEAEGRLCLALEGAK